MSRVFITGGTGFIGSHLARHCLRRGDQVTILARPDSDVWRLDDMLDQLTILRATQDGSDQDAVSEALRQAQPQLVFLLAAETRFRDKSGLDSLPAALNANVEALRLILRGIAALDHPPQSVVRTGTLAELSRDDPHAERPDGIYGLSALLGTNLLRIWANDTGIPAVTARLSLTYGGDQSPDFFVPGAIHQALGAHLEAPRNPGALRDLLHIDDVIRALLLISDHAAELPRVVNVSTGQPHRLADVTRRIAELTGQDPGPIPASDRTAHDNIVSSPPSPELGAVGWRQNIPLDDGLNQVIEWERSHSGDSKTRRST